MSREKIIGIDLGTTNSCVAVVEGGRPVVIANSEGQATTPSVVAFDQRGDRHVGINAKRQAIKNPETTIQSIKRHMGSNFWVTVGNDTYSPEQISAYILQKLKAQAEAHLGEAVKKAIITVPAYFDDAQRLSTRDAGEIAGLEVVRIVNEPTACALAYGLKTLKQESRIVIFDFGGGTFDVTILDFSEQVLQVKATNGNNQLGGDDFDQRIIDWLAGQFFATHKSDLVIDAGVLQRLKEAAERAKIELSGRESTEIQLPFLSYSADGPLHLEAMLARKEFNRITSDLVEAVALPIQTALSDSKLPAEQIDHVIMVGGTTRIPAVQEFIRRFFQKEPLRSVNPDEAVALGAAIQGGILTGEIQEVLLLDVLPMTLGIELEDGRMERIFQRNTAIPVSKKRAFTTTVAGQTSVPVHVLQGESSLASGNKSLSRFDLGNIQNAPAGVPKFEVTFDVDVDGIFSCTATDLARGSSWPVELQRTHGLSRDDLDRLAEEARLRAEQEQEEQDRQAALIMAESTISEAERTLKRWGGDKDGPGLQVRQAVIELQKAMEIADTAEIEELTEKLEMSLMRCVRGG